MSEVTPDFDDGVPVDDDAEPDDAGIEHEASAEDVLALVNEDEDEGDVPEGVQ